MCGNNAPFTNKTSCVVIMHHLRTCVVIMQTNKTSCVVIMHHLRTKRNNAPYEQNVIRGNNAPFTNKKRHVW